MLGLILPVRTTIDAGFNISGGHPVGTSRDAGYNVSGGRPEGTTLDNEAQSQYIEGDPRKLADHIEQFKLPVSWNTDKCYLSVDERTLISARKYIGQHIRFDSKAKQPFISNIFSKI